MIYDCFTFFNELDMVDIRLHHLYNYVDYFVIVEGDKTHRGIPKEYIFEKNFSRYEWALDKIIYFKVKLPVDKDAWVAENAQRNAISLALKDANDNDIIIISDCDEIPSYSSLDEVKVLKEPKALIQKACCWYVNVCDPRIPWPGPVAMPYGILKQNSPQVFRNSRFNINRINNGGCHFTWLGTSKEAANKIASFAHSEFDTEGYKDPFILQANRDKLVDPFGRDNAYHGEVFSLDDINFPPYLKENKEAYKHLFKD